MTPWMSCRFPAEAGHDRERGSRAAGQRLTPTPAPIGRTHLVEVTDGAISSPSPPFRGRAIAFGETVAFLSSVIPAQAGIQRPKTRHSPLESPLRGNDGNREVGELKCDCPASRGREQMMARSIEFPPSFVVFRPETSLTGVR